MKLFLTILISFAAITLLSVRCSNTVPHTKKRTVTLHLKHYSRNEMAVMENGELEPARITEEDDTVQVGDTLMDMKVVKITDEAITFKASDFYICNSVNPDNTITLYRGSSIVLRVPVTDAVSTTTISWEE